MILNSGRSTSSGTFEDDDDFDINNEGSGEDEESEDFYYMDYGDEEEDGDYAKGQIKKFG